MPLSSSRAAEGLGGLGHLTKCQLHLEKLSSEMGGMGKRLLAMNLTPR